MTDGKTTNITGIHGRDLNKVFVVHEVPPLDLAGLVLRLVSGLRVESYSALMESFTAPDPDNAGEQIDAVMSLLRGADPTAVHALISDALSHVTICPDPKHPGAERAMMVSDIQEIRTLGDVLVAFAKLHFA